MYNSPLAKAYPAIFHKEEAGGYFIEFTDLQSAYTGINEDNIAYGIAMAEEVLGVVLADMIEKKIIHYLSQRRSMRSNMKMLILSHLFVWMSRSILKIKN